MKASTGTVTDGDREIVQEEVAQLKEEIERISANTQFNGQNLLDGTFDVKGYTNDDYIKVNTFSEKTPKGTYTVDSITFADEVKNGVVTGNKLVTAITLGGDFPPGVEAVPDGVNEIVAENGFVTIKGSNGFELKLDLNDAPNGTVTDLKVEISDVGPMRLQVGANEGQILAVEIPPISLRNMGIERIDVSTQAGAQDALNRMDGAIGFVSRVRGKLGAYQNRLESTVNSLDVSEESMTAAYSRLMDVDMAEEMTQYTTNQILTQAGTSMLAQANERPSQVLQLLQ